MTASSRNDFRLTFICFVVMTKKWNKGQALLSVPVLNLKIDKADLRWLSVKVQVQYKTRAIGSFVAISNSKKVFSFLMVAWS